MAVRNIRVIGDRMEPRRIYAGTRGSYITEVAFTFSGEWDGLTKKLIFYPVRGKPVYINYTYGSEKIPYEVMRYSGDAIMLMSGYSVETDGSLGVKIVTASAFVAVDPAESDTQNEPDIPEATEFEKIVAKLGAPYIGENGNWFVWDVYTHEFADTGLPARGEQGETGRGLTILGKYGSLDDLRASVKDAQPGDAYAVGEKAPYTIYIWDDVKSDFTNHGDLRGVGITKIEQITDNTGSGEPNTIRIVTDDGAEYDYTVYNGERGHPGNIWIGETEPPDDSYTIWLNPGGAVSGFLESHQGTENAGRVLVVGEDGIVRPGEYAGGGGGTITEESDPTVPAWAKQPQKPTYTAEEVGALSESELDSAIDSALAEAKESGEFDGEDGKSGVYVGGDPIPSGYNVQIDPSGESVEFVEVDAGLTKSGYAADAKVVGDRLKEMAQEAPVQSVNGKTGAVKLSASDVGAASTAELTAEKTAREQAVADLNARLGQQNLLIAEGETVEEALAWLETNGDKTKAYLMPDDFFYTYRKTTEAGGTLYRNLLPEATDTDRVTIYGDDYTGDGVKDGYITGQRLSSSGALTAQAGMSVSGFIPAKEGDILRIKGLTGMTSKAAYVISYNSANEKVNYKAFAQDGANIITPNTGFMSVAEDGTITFPLVSTYFGTGFNAIRFAGVFDHTAIVTINEEIVAGTGTVIVEKWASTGHALVSSDYGNEIAAVKSIVDIHTAEINALKEGISEDTAEDALLLIKNWDAPIYDANIPVFELSAEKAAMTDATKTPDALYGMYDALMAKYPHYITKTDLGICSDGVNHVYRYDFKDPEQRHTNNRNSETKAKAILVSGIHYEWAGMFGLYYALEEIAENPVLRDLRRNVHLIVIPCCNPFVTIRDNIEASGGQQNANGVEVHRNFEVEFKYPGDAGYLEPGELHHGGTEPLSEVETQYIDKVLSENTDAAFFVTCHNYNLDEIYGVSFLWPSVATAYMCNMGYRLIDKMSQVWMDRYGEELAPGIASYRTDLLESWDTRLGYAQISGSPGTETKQATKYGIQAANVEICERFHVHGTKNNPEPICSSFTMSRGAEAYVNFLLMAFGCYDPKDKKEYYLG